LPLPPPWPLTGGRLPADVAQAWSLLEAMSSCEPRVQVELETLLSRMSVPEKRVWLTRRLVRHHRSHQAPDGGVEEPPLAFVEGDRSLTPAGQLSEIRRQMCEATGLGAEDICGEFEVRFKDEQGVGSAVLREWMDMIAREAYLHPGHRLLRSYDRRQSFLPDPGAFLQSTMADGLRVSWTPVGLGSVAELHSGLAITSSSLVVAVWFRRGHI